jgi:hypothetical protein
MADVSVNLTGVAATGSPGSPSETGSANVTPTGVAGTGSPGSPSITGDANVTLSGRAGTGHTGSPIVLQDTSVLLEGHQAFADPGVLFNNLVPAFMCCENGYRLQTIFGDVIPIPPPVTGCDDVSWDYDNTLGSQSFHTLCFSPDLGIMVAGGNANNTATSTDGLTWTQHTSATNGATPGIAWAPSLGYFIGVGQVGRTRTSANGISWTENSPVSGTPTFNSVAWSPTLGLAVASRSTSTAVCLYSSPDGVNWTPITTSVTTQSCRQVIWVPPGLLSATGMFVVVGTQGLVMTSTDGAAFTIQTTPDSTHVWTGVAYSDTLNLLVACSTTRSGVDNRTMRSSDGFSWTLGSSPAFPANDYSLASVGWSPTMQMFAFVGTGSILSGNNGCAMHSVDGLTLIVDALPVPPGPPFRFDFVGSFDTQNRFVAINQVDEGGGFLIGDCADVVSARLYIRVDGVTVFSADIASTDPTWISSGRAGLTNQGLQGVVNPADIASWGTLIIEGDAYHFADNFSRADSDDLGANYNFDQIGSTDAPFHIVSDQFQDWDNAAASTQAALATPTSCPSNMVTQSIQATLGAFGAGIGMTQPSQTIEFAARVTSATLSGASMYYILFQADRLDPTNGYAAAYHVHFPDSDPDNAVYTLIGDVSAITIDTDSIVSFAVVNL